MVEERTENAIAIRLRPAGLRYVSSEDGDGNPLQCGSVNAAQRAPAAAGADGARTALEPWPGLGVRPNASALPIKPFDA